MQLLGLCQRSQKLSMGSALLGAIASRQVHCVVLSTDASDRTKKQIHDKSEFAKIPVIDVLNRNELSSAIGKRNIVAVGVTDRGLSDNITACLKENEVKL